MPNTTNLSPISLDYTVTNVPRPTTVARDERKAFPGGLLVPSSNLGVMNNYVAIALVVIGGCILSVVTFIGVDKMAISKAQAEFEQTAIMQIDAIQRNIETQLEAVRSLSSFLESSKYVDRRSFRVFVSGALARYPGIKALKWIPRVTAAQRSAYERAARVYGFSEFQITARRLQRDLVRAGERDEYFPVYFVEPYQGNELALGFDLGSNVGLLGALEASRDSGELGTSDHLNFFRETAGQLTFLVFAPVYRIELPHDTLEQRRKNLAGFALGVFGVADVVTRSFTSQPSTGFAQRTELALYVYDEDAVIDDQFLYAFVPYSQAGALSRIPDKDLHSGLHVARSVDVANRTWTIVARPDGALLDPWTSGVAWAALGVGLVFTTLLVGYLVSSLRRTRTIEVLVEQRTGELSRANTVIKESEARLRAFIDNSPHAISLKNTDGSYILVNRPYEEMIDLTSEEIRGKKSHEVFAKEFADSGVSQDRAVLETGQVVEREEELRREDGDHTWLTVKFPIRDAANNINAIGAISTDITERKEIDRMKTEFIAVVSHELRTPLTGIFGSLGLLRGGVLGELSEEVNKMIVIAYDNAERLIRLINDILNIEKIEAGKMEFRNAPVDICHLIEQTIETNRPYGSERRQQRRGARFEGYDDIKFVFERSLPGVKVYADSDRLTQVSTNLLSNAAKFSPPGGTVDVSVSRHNGFVRVAVSDQGPGIPEEFHDRVFEKFSQADSSDTREKCGTGLGLSICKAIVEKLSGEIGFDTKTDVGTTFYFDLPEWKETDVGDPTDIN